MTNGLEKIIPDSNSEPSKKGQQLEQLWWAIVLIWAGFVLVAETREFLPEIGKASTWSWIFLGGGAVALLGALVRSFSQSLPDPSIWDWFWAGFCLIIGLGGFTPISITWPLILILSGAFLFARSFWHRA